ncbi:MAG: hypothetical protein COY68_01050 [Candidatus Levybacteria bacterium CG_4_10_14_0_8_um_filter_35_23]|nr:MAG: hypothetical protein COY68_01050 [Candidatus Levybacteria bacterium CG_4_10_14_0_8_um_filter_35_23]
MILLQGVAVVSRTWAFVNNEVCTVNAKTGTTLASGGVATGEQLWPNVYTLGSIMEDGESGFKQQIYIAQDGARLFSGTEWWPDGADSATTRQIDVLIKTKESGTEIDSGNVTVFLRHYPATLPTRATADLYDHFGIDLTAGGRNAVPLATSADLNNTTDDGTVGGYSDITIAFVNGTIGYTAISGSFTNFETVTQATSGATGIFLYQTTATGAGTMTLGNVNGTFAGTDTITGGTSGKTAAATATFTKAYKMSKNFEQGSSYNYSVIVGCATRTLKQVYEYFKLETRIGSTFTMYPTTYPQGGPLSFATQEGQLYIRAHEDTQTSPTNTFSPVKPSPFGTFAGGKLFGAQGVWVENMASADIQNFQLIDSDGSTRTPPNKQSITITNLLSDDRISVFRTTSGTTINKAVYTAAAGNNTGNTSFVVTEAIEVDTPSTGVIRVVDTSDTTNTRESRYSYTSWDGTTKTFSGLSPVLDRAYTQTDDTVYIPFIDTTASGTSVSITVIYAADRSILLRVRRYTATAILPFETTGSFISTGYSTSAIRTTDTIVG